MKAQELRKLIREEVSKVLNEENGIHADNSNKGRGNITIDLNKDFKSIIKEANHFLKNKDVQELNKIMFNLYDGGRIKSDEYSKIQALLKKLDK